MYRIFLDVLSEFIIQCRVHLNDWLFVLLTRLLHKIGSDILPSLHSKVAKVLDIVRLVSQNYLPSFSWQSLLELFFISSYRWFLYDLPLFIDDFLSDGSFYLFDFPYCYNFRDSFPYDQQFQILTKYIIDSTQTPTLKVSRALLLHPCFRPIISLMPWKRISQLPIFHGYPLYNCLVIKSIYYFIL